MNDPQTYLLRRPLFIGAKYSIGKTLVEKQKLYTCYTQYPELKVGLSSLGNRWKDIVYGMPYYGIGIGVYSFNSQQTGHPISTYLFQGGILKILNRKSMLKYEWNFGSSFNWKKYDPVTNPGNQCISTQANVYFAASLIYTYVYSKDLDFNAGVTFSHVSNGATHMPNSGVNTLAGFVGVSYHFERERIRDLFNASLRPPPYEDRRLISDLSFHSSVRQRKYSTEETGLSSSFIDRSFMVAGLNYGLLLMPDYEYRYGASVDLIYDESAGFTVKKIGETPDGRDIAETHYGSFGGRFGVGLSARGEIVMPRYSVSAQVGYEIIRGNKEDNRLYQIFSVRIPFWNNLYGSFVLRSQKFSKAQYMFFGVGYMIDHKPFGKK
jgi:hypothetical protein